MIWLSHVLGLVKFAQSDKLIWLNAAVADWVPRRRILLSRPILNRVRMDLLSGLKSGLLAGPNRPTYAPLK
jgi:hypothetical protein